jgi:plastocyanin
MYKPTPIRNIIKPIVVAALVVMTLAGLATSLVHTRAAAATYNVIVGTDTSYGLESLAFFPQTLKVHKGDTVTWQFRGFHNARFDQKPLDLVVVNDIDGKQLPEFNPAILFPNAKSGDAYKPGANSGVQALVNPTGPAFSVVMDIAPGTYTYVCDIHPGMVGTIVVVDAKTDIPSPADVDKEGEDGVKTAIEDGDKAIMSALKTFLPEVKGDTLKVSAGLQQGNTAVMRFYPEDATIQVGQSVTWTVPQGMDLHTVNFPLAKEGRIDVFAPAMDSKKQLHGLITDAANANVKSGAELPADGVAKSGIVGPTQSFTLKFTKPGVYAYYCAIHPNQFGTIEVVPPQQP